jgi:hypothetical protein
LETCRKEAASKIKASMEGWESIDWSNPARKVASGGFCKHGNNSYRFRKDPKKRSAPLVIICFLCVGIISLH